MATQLLNLSSSDLKKAATLQAQIEVLQAKLASLLGSDGPTQTPITKGDRGKMPAAQREKLSKAAKARWKKAKAEGKTTL